MQNYSETTQGATVANDSAHHAQSTLDPSLSSDDRRKVDRYRVTWRATIIANGQTYEGRIKDISLRGAAILDEINFKPETYITLRVQVPSLTNCCKPKILTIHGIAAYSIHDVNHLCFRTGVSFVEFDSASDRAYLEQCLKSHYSSDS